MNIRKLYNKIFCVVQWSIGFAEGNIEQIMREKKIDLHFKWLPLANNIFSVADPFILKDKGGNINLFYEEFSVIDVSKYGKLKLFIIDDKFNIRDKYDHVLLDADTHASYPLIIVENGTTYIVPETSAQNKVSVYEYDFTNKKLINEKNIIKDIPLLDSTIFTHNNKYWLFATLNENEYEYSKLYIYYSDSLTGQYKAHANNPVKNNINGSRPAGNILKVDGELYRPAQNCAQHYGESISINKITKLTETEFEEEFYFRIPPDKTSKYNAGIHTINVVGDIIVIDGIKMLFKPLTKWKLFLKKKFKSNSRRKNKL